MLEADAAHKLVVAFVPGKVVFHGKYLVVNRVLVGKQLITESHVRKVRLSKVSGGDFHEGERLGVAVTHVIEA